MRIFEYSICYYPGNRYKYTGSLIKNELAILQLASQEAFV